MAQARHAFSREQSVAGSPNGYGNPVLGRCEERSNAAI